MKTDEVCALALQERRMTHKLDFDALAKDVLALLRKYELAPEAFGVSLAIPSKDFDVIAAAYPGHSPEMILISSGDGIQWYVQIERRRALEDFPPGATLTPPPDG
jgi:hypothetical protein